MTSTQGVDDQDGRGRRVLVADDDAAARALYATLLELVDGVETVVAAGDGAEAVRLATTMAVDVAVLDLNMPRLDGVGAAAALTKLHPAAAVALHSSDSQGLRSRAGRLGFRLFDKRDFDDVTDWVAGEIAAARRARPRERDLRCSRCGYGVAAGRAPGRCPICGRTATWVGRGVLHSVA